MRSIPYQTAKADIERVIKDTCADHVPTLLIRDDDQSVVIISLEDWESLQESNYLMRSPENARRLHEAMEQLESGEGIERELPPIE